jgi:hypothetical protein|tara:strand:+ start:5307 stop:5843 length:537 start_codon:yes stop_codon:yes gene_type:complete
MARLDNIESVIKNVGVAAERVLRKQLSIVRGGSGKRMNSKTKSLSKSLKSKIVKLGSSILLVVEGNKYGRILDKGFNNIPYTRGSKQGKKPGSSYIKGLARWAAKKYTGGDYKKALQMAFAIANKQKNEASAPANPGWIENVRGMIDNDVSSAFSEKINNAIEIDTMKILNRTIETKI